MVLPVQRKPINTWFDNKIKEDRTLPSEHQKQGSWKEIYAPALQRGRSDFKGPKLLHDELAIQPWYFCLHIVGSFSSSIWAISYRRSCCQILRLHKVPLFYVKQYILFIISVIYSTDVHHVPAECPALGIKDKWDAFVSGGESCNMVKKVCASYFFL